MNSQVYRMPEGERIARLETRVEVIVEAQAQASKVMERIDGKVDDIHTRISARDSTRAWAWKMGMACVGLSAAVSTVVVALI